LALALALASDLSRTGNSGDILQRTTSSLPIGKYVRSLFRLSGYISRSVKNMTRKTLTPAAIGALIRKTRKDAGLRQDELAGAAGVGLRFIVDLEAGKPTAQIGKTLQVLAALGCSLEITPPPTRDKTGTS
jgi:y4mF family transcriptional regulator